MAIIQLAVLLKLCIDSKTERDGVREKSAEGQEKKIIFFLFVTAKYLNEFINFYYYCY